MKANEHNQIESSAYLFACHNGETDISSSTVFCQLDDKSVAQLLLDLFTKEYGNTEGKPVFHAKPAVDTCETDKILFDEAITDLAFYDDPDPGIYDPPPSRQTLLRAFYAHRAERWLKLLQSKKTSNTSPIRETPSKTLQHLQKLLKSLVAIDNGILSIGTQLLRLRKNDPYGVVSKPMKEDASFEHVQEVQTQIASWVAPIQTAVKDAEEACHGVSSLIESFTDDPTRWETDLRSELRLLRDALASLPLHHGSVAVEQSIVSLGFELHEKGTRLQDGLETLIAREYNSNLHPNSKTHEAKQNDTNFNNLNPIRKLASALQDLRLVTCELLHCSEKVDIFPESEVESYFEAQKHAESLVQNINVHLAYGQKNPGQIETKIRSVLHKLFREMEHIVSGYNDRPGVYPLPIEMTTPGWNAVKELMPLEMTLSITTAKPEELQMPAKEQEVSGLIVLQLLAQAYYKVLESVITMSNWCSSLDLELNQSYLWVTGTISNLLKNHEDLKDFPCNFEPLFSDLYPTTVRDWEWDDMVAPHAEDFLSTVQKYVHQKGTHSLEKGSSGWIFVEMFRESVDVAINRALAYNNRMRSFIEKNLDASSNDRCNQSTGAKSVHKEFDIFICHASEDKATVAMPLYEALIQNKVQTFIDNMHIKWGDSLIEKINHALSISKFVIVILSTNSVDKAWPKKELNAALAREIDGYVKVLPLVVGSEGDTNVIFEKLPLLEDKLYKKWTGTPDNLVAEIKKLLE